jgi:hypothetical protein
MYVKQWLAYLSSADLMVAIPLLAAGAALMMFGWRLWKVSVGLSFALIGVWVVRTQFPPGYDAWMYALAVAGVLGAATYWPARQCVVVLGGLISAGLVSYLCSDLRLTGLAFWALVAVTFIGGSAVAMINRRLVIIGVTAFLGAILVMSGLLICSKLSPGFHGHFTSFATRSSVLLPFALLVPSVVSSCYQAAETTRQGVEL